MERQYYNLLSAEKKKETKTKKFKMKKLGSHLLYESVKKHVNSEAICPFVILFHAGISRLHIITMTTVHS